jgi:hypothetical protein
VLIPNLLALFMVTGCHPRPTQDSTIPDATNPRAPIGEDDDNWDSAQVDTDPGDTAGVVPCDNVEKRVTIGMVSPWYQNPDPEDLPWQPIVQGVPPNVEVSTMWGIDVYWRLYPRLYNFKGTVVRYDASIFDVATGSLVWHQKGYQAMPPSGGDRPCSVRAHTFMQQLDLKPLGGTTEDHPYAFMNGHEIFITVDVEGVDHPDDIGTFHAETYGTASFPPPP